MKKNEIIRVVRYIRPTIEETNKTNLYGITLVFYLNYKLDEAFVVFSICNGDNFCKSYGVLTAEAKPRGFSFPIIKGKSLINTFIEYVYEDSANIVQSSYMCTHLAFMRLSRKLSG